MRYFYSALCLLAYGMQVHADEPIDCVQHHCVAIVDAGSSGSRLHIYTYDEDAKHAPIHITEQWSKKIRPGFALVEARSNEVANYLNQLFSNAPVNNLPVYFYATGGMRMLPQPKQQQLYGLLNNWFSNQTQWRLIKAKTITGTEEGLYGWAAVNYQLGRLNDTQKDLVGIMDMGGASVQIAFPLPESLPINTSDVISFEQYGRRFNIFVHSFLGLGQAEVEHQFLDAPQCFANNYPMPDGTFAAGNGNQCKDEVADLINAVHGVHKTISPFLQQTPSLQWYALGGLVYTARSTPFNFQEGQFTSTDLLEKGEQVCQKPWSDLTSQYPNEEYLYGYCLFSAYYYALMVNGYGIDAQQNLNYLTGNAEGDWTLGAVLLQNQAALKTLSY